VREADIIVLAADHGTLRPGARLFPLGHWMSRHSGVFGDEVAVTARLRDHLPGTPSVVVVVAPGATPESFMDVPLPGLSGMLGAAGPMTVSVTCPLRTDYEASVLSMYNQHADALPEALVEAVASARRRELLTHTGNVVLLLQQFVPASASAVVHVSPARDTPVRIDGRRGLTERLSEADTFEVDGTTVSETLAWKPTASLAAPGGTSTVAMPDGWQRSIGQDTVRELAAMAKEAAMAAGTRLTLDVVLGQRGPVVLRCRPGEPHTKSQPDRDDIPGQY
jgi:hypothetical protein